MAQKTFTKLIDDIDGSEATESLTFALQGKEYEIDLNEEHAIQMLDEIGRWVERAHRVSKPRSGAPRRRAAGADPRIAKIREWAKEQGIEVSDRGRLSADVMKAYEDAHGSEG